MMLISHLIKAVAAAGALQYLVPVSARSATYRDTRASIASRHSAPACADGTTIENLWLVERLNVTYTSDELVHPGNASWSITNTLTNTTERINCTLRANYICELNGTPGDASFHIWLQINLDTATFTLNQTLPCRNGPAVRSAYALGTAELYLICPTRGADEDFSCYSDDDGTGFANGDVTLLGSSGEARAARSLQQRVDTVAAGSTGSMRQRMGKWRQLVSDRGIEGWRESSVRLSRGSLRTTRVVRPPLES